MKNSDSNDSCGPEAATGIAPPDQVRRILVCQLRQIGDVLLATPSIELLARRYPGAELHVFTEKKCLPMLAHNPHIHELWPVDKKALGSVPREYAWYAKIASRRFDLVVDFQQLPRCRAVVAMTRAPVRLSFPPPWYLRLLYTHWVQPAPAYAAAYKAGVLAPLGIRWNGERPRLYLTRAEREEGSALLSSFGLESGKFFSLDVTHRQSTRRWPGEYYATLIDMLAEALPDYGFLLSYGPGEKEEVSALAARCRRKDRIALPSEILNLRQMAACMEHAALQLGNCSSPRHMAVALGVPTLTIQGATGGGWLFPAPDHLAVQARNFMDMPCQPCNRNACSLGLPCLTKLTPDLVFPKVMAHLAAFGQGRGSAL